MPYDRVYLYPYWAVALTAEQRKIANLILSIGGKVGASPMEKLAAIETGLVESGLSNPAGGTGDSAGWRQERKSLYSDPTNVTDSITRFFQEAKAVRGKYKTAGELAAAVQRPKAEYRGRYQANRDSALSVINSLTGGKGIPSGGFDGTTTTTTTPGKTTIGATSGDLSSLLPLLAASLKRPQQPQAASLPDPSALPYLKMAAPVVQSQAVTPDQSSGPSLDEALQAITQATGPSLNVSTSPSTTTTTVNRAPNGRVHSIHDVLSLRGTTTFDGKPVAAWIGHILTYARNHGWKGTLQSGYRSDAQQKQIYDSGVRPAAKPKSEGGTGSNHTGTVYPVGAGDVSQADQLSQILKHSPYAQILVWAGRKDPVHFSHPSPNGSY